MPSSSLRPSPSLPKGALGRSLVHSKINRTIYHPNTHQPIRHAQQKIPSTLPLTSLVEESSQLEAYIATTLAAQKSFAAQRGYNRRTVAEPINPPSLPANEATVTGNIAVPIPRRPKYYRSKEHSPTQLPTVAIEETNRSEIAPDERATPVHTSPSLLAYNLFEQPTPQSQNAMAFGDREEHETPLITSQATSFTISNPRGQKQSSHTVTPNMPASPKFNDSSTDAANNTISPAELEQLENEAFLGWRRQLARLEEHYGYTLTPFEKNFEVWKQLWRVIERSHIILIILDARNPLLFRAPDLEKYIKEVDSRKQVTIVLNKADFMDRSLRKQWLNYFERQGIEVIFFSAIRELLLQGAILPSNNAEPNAEAETTMAFEGITQGYGNLRHEQQTHSKSDILDSHSLLTLLQLKKQQLAVTFAMNVSESSAEAACSDFVVGLVGYPNVGKSSMINSLFGSKKTGVSRQAGKTKHFQTLPMPSVGLTLCDCPGLVFPSIVVSKEHLLINGIISINSFRGSYVRAIQLICDEIAESVCYKYKLSESSLLYIQSRKPLTYSMDAQAFLTQLAETRHFYSGGRGGIADLFRAASLVIRDYCCGRLLYSHAPPVEEEVGLNHAVMPLTANSSGLLLSELVASTPGTTHPTEIPPGYIVAPQNHPRPMLRKAFDEVAEIDNFLRKSSSENEVKKKLTRRGVRYKEKQILKGKSFVVDLSGNYRFK